MCLISQKWSNFINIGGSLLQRTEHGLIVCTFDFLVVYQAYVYVLFWLIPNVLFIILKNEMWAIRIREIYLSKGPLFIRNVKLLLFKNGSRSIPRFIYFFLLMVSLKLIYLVLRPSRSTHWDIGNCASPFNTRIAIFILFPLLFK